MNTFFNKIFLNNNLKRLHLMHKSFPTPYVRASMKFHSKCAHN